MGKLKNSKKDISYLKNLREASNKLYSSMTALNWGTTAEDGSHVFLDRYKFNWKKLKGPNKDLVPLDCDLYQYLKKFKEENEMAGRSVNVFIGTDSQNHLSYTRFVTVICLQVERNGVHVLVSKMDLPKIYDYKYRLLKEADVSAEFTRNNKFLFDNLELPLEIHCDYNSNKVHKSNLVVVEALNYLSTLGLIVKIKNSAVGATYAADHFC